MYAVKEVFYTLQGEGANSGRPAVFCRFAGCNLWSGRERDRAKAVCQFCDTDFVGIDGLGGGRFVDALGLSEHIAAFWPAGQTSRFVVCTGGEPLLQLDKPLVDALHSRGFSVAVETNGTLPLPTPLDWVCVSPKAGAEVVLREGDELKLVYPQAALLPEALEDLVFEHRFLQPMDGARDSVARTVAYCLAHPQWRLSLQTHKLLGLR